MCSVTRLRLAENLNKIKTYTESHTYIPSCVNLTLFSKTPLADSTTSSSYVPYFSTLMISCVKTCFQFQSNLPRSL